MLPLGLVWARAPHHHPQHLLSSVPQPREAVAITVPEETKARLVGGAGP